MVSSEGCFIATAVYGSYVADEVLVLRELRYRELESSGLGRFVIRFYYFVSLPIAELLEVFPFAKKPTKYVLDKIVSNRQKNFLFSSKASNSIDQQHSACRL